jgi:hypothetical protein
MNRSAPAWRAASSIAASSAPGRPRARFAATVPGTRAGCWEAQATWSRRQSRSASVRGRPPATTNPSSGPGEPEQHPAKGGVAGSAGSDHGHQLAGLEVQVDPIQRRQRPPRVADGDRPKPGPHRLRLPGRRELDPPVRGPRRGA